MLFENDMQRFVQMLLQNGVPFSTQPGDHTITALAYPNRVVVTFSDVGRLCFFSTRSGDDE